MRHASWSIHQRAQRVTMSQSRSSYPGIMTAWYVSNDASLVMPVKFL